MGHSQDEKARSHDRIVEIAAARIRESGTDAPGVAEIMTAAGLTHGGFYKHFASRDELVAAAVDRALADGEQAVATLTEDVADPLATFVDWYTSTEHRDDPAHGCAVVALGADAPRAGAAVRAAYRDQVTRYLDRLTDLLAVDDSTGDDAAARAAAVTSLSALVGALLIARAVDDAALSDEILHTVRDAVTGQTFG